MIDYSADGAGRVARDVEVFAEAEDLPAHGAAVSRRFRRDRRPPGARLGTGCCADACRSGPSWSVRCPYGAPQLDVPVCLNVNENPYPPSEPVVAEIAAAVAEAARSMNRYPERDALALRADLAALPRPRADRRPGLGGQRQQRGDAARAAGLRRARAARVLSFAPTYSMYPEYARDTHTGWRDLPAPGRLHHRRRRGRGRDRASTGPTSCWSPARTTRPAPRSPWTWSPRSATPRPGSSWSTRPTTSSPGPARRARWSCCRDYPRLAVSRTMSKAFAFAGGRLGYLAAAPAFVDALRIVRLPYHLSAVTQAVARVALAHAAEMLAARRPAARGPRRPGRLAGRPGAARSPSPTPTSCCSAGSPTGTRSGRRLLDRGVLIREVGPGRLAAGLGRHPGGDGRVHGRAARGARPTARRSAADGGPPMSRAPDPDRRRSSGPPRSRASGSASTSTAPASPTISHRRRLLRPHAHRAGQARAVRPRGGQHRRLPHRRPPHRRGHRDRARPGDPRRRSATSAGSAGSATRWCRWTRRWPRPWSTSPAGRTACTPASRTGRSTSGSAAAAAGRRASPYTGSLTRHVLETLAFHAHLCLHVTRARRSRPAPHRRGPVQGAWPGRCATRSRSTRGSTGVPSTKGAL